MASSRGRIGVAVGALAIAIGLRAAPLGSTARAAGEQRPTSHEFRTLGSGAEETTVLPIRVPRERGALRFFGAGVGPELELHLLEGPRGLGAVEVRRPDFATDRFAEFYGIDAGHSTAYLRSHRSCSGLFDLDIAVGALVEYGVPPLSQLVPRQLSLLVGDRPFLRPASILIELDGARTLLPWNGEPIDLDWPLAHPDRIWVRPVPEAQGASSRAGIRVDDPPTRGPLVINLPVGRATISARLVGTANTVERKGATTFVGNFREGAGARPILASVPVDDFDVPPAVTTAASPSVPSDELLLRELERGAVRLGIGSGPGPTAILWRAVHLEADQELTVDVLDPPPVQSSRLSDFLDRRLLPDRMLARGEEAEETIFEAPGTSFVDSARPLFGWGPRERWTQDGRSTRRSARLESLSTVSGDTLVDRPLVPHAIDLPPSPAADGAELRVTVTVPGDPARIVAVHQQSRVVAASEPALEVPAGRLEARLEVDGSPAFALSGFVVNGELLHGGWLAAGEKAAERPPLDVRSLVTSTSVFVEGRSGAVDGPTIERTIEPLLLHLRDRPDRFDRHVLVNGDGVRIEGPVEASRKVGWDDVVAELGFDPGQFGIAALDLMRLPGGETARLLREGDVELPSEGSGPIEGRADVGHARLWCLVGGEVDLADRGRARLFVSTPDEREILVVSTAAVVRCALAPDQPLDLEFAAPAPLTIVPLVDGEVPVDGAAVTVQLEPEDVLTVHLD